MKELKKHFDGINDFELQIAVTEIIESEYETEEVDIINENIYFEVADEASFQKALSIVNELKEKYKSNRYYLRFGAMFYNCNNDTEKSFYY